MDFTLGQEKIALQPLLLLFLFHELTTDLNQCLLCLLKLTILQQQLGVEKLGLAFHEARIQLFMVIQ